MDLLEQSKSAKQKSSVHYFYCVTKKTWTSLSNLNQPNESQVAIRTPLWNAKNEMRSAQFRILRHRRQQRSNRSNSSRHRRQQRSNCSNSSRHHLLQRFLQQRISHLPWRLLLRIFLSRCHMIAICHSCLSAVTARDAIAVRWSLAKVKRRSKSWCKCIDCPSIAISRELSRQQVF